MQILQVLAIDSPEDKMGITVMFCVRVDGVKLPAIVFYKKAAKTRVFSKKIESELVAPSNVSLKSSKNACLVVSEA